MHETAGLMEEAPQPKQSPACGRMKQPVRRERQEVPLCTHDATESRSRGGPGVRGKLPGRPPRGARSRRPATSELN